MPSHFIMQAPNTNVPEAEFAVEANRRGLTATLEMTYRSEVEFQEDTLEGWRIVRHFRAGTHVIRYSFIMEDSGETALVLCDGTSYTDKSWRCFHIAAKTMSIAESILEILMRAIPPKGEADDNNVDLTLWCNTPNSGPVQRNSTISAPAWREMERNYPSQCRAAVDPLFAQLPTGDNGRLILWHGPPGTGKTNAVRAFMLQHKTKMHTRYISDPEQFLGEPNYMFSVLSAPSQAYVNRETGVHVPMKNLIVIEDADEFLQADAKRARGQSVGRLLNLTDGIMGQGLDFIMLITTNEHMEHIHPAVARPGRCMANVEFPLLTPSEAQNWLGAPLPYPHRESYSLAELYDMKRTQSQIVLEKEVVSFGQYL